MPLLAEPVPYCAFLCLMQGLPACAIPGRIATTQHRTISPVLLSTCTPLKIRQAPQLLLPIDVCPSPFFPIPHPDRIPCPPLPRYALALFVRVHLGEDEAVTLQKKSDDSLTPGHDLRRYIASSKSLDSPDCIFTRARGPLPN